jgi:hypothetical protein
MEATAGLYKGDVCAIVIWGFQGGTMKKLLMLVAALTVLAGCSTTIKTSQEMPSSVRSGIVVREATATYGSGASGPEEVAPRLEQAVLKATAARSGSGTQIKLKMTITNYELVNAGTRALVGALAGSNKLDVDVEVLDIATGKTVGHYEVQRESNPGGYGIFYSQATALIDEAAKGVVEGLYGSS